MVDRSLRITFLGNDGWSVPPLEALAASRHEVALVLTRVPRPVRRGRGLAPTPVAEAARRLELPLAEVETVKVGPGLEELERSRPDALVVVAYGEILPPSVLDLPSIAPVNLHFSLLPQLRGASPVQAALMLGLDTTGVTTMVMDPGLDTGPVLRQRSEPILPEDDAGSLGSRLARIGGEVLVETLDALAAGGITPIAQDASLATMSTRLGPEDRRLDWVAPASDLVNLVRALAPEPAAVTVFRDEPLKIYRATSVDAVGEPGTIVGVDEAGFVVATGLGGLRPLEVAPAGRRRMSAADFARGHRPLRGERLG